MTKPSSVVELLSVIDRFAGVPILVVGDVMLDHYIWGKANRISQEAPVPIVEVTEESRRAGGAGSVSRNLVKLGAKVSLCGIVGDDSVGRELVTILKDEGIEVDSILVDRSRPTTVKTRVIAQAQQVVRFDREKTEQVSKSLSEGLAAALQAKVEDHKGLIISDYAKGSVSPALLGRIQVGFEQGLFGVNSRPVLVDPKIPDAQVYRNIPIIKPNRKEAERLTGLKIIDRPTAIVAAKNLLEKTQGEMVLITLGEHGMVLVSKVAGHEEIVEVETVAREVFDVSGAGDTVAAVFTLAMSVGATPRQAAELANFAAGVVVGEIGTVAISQEELREVISRELGD